MTWTERGKVEHGALVLARPLALPDGTEVVVQIVPVGAHVEGTATAEDLRKLPFFGMWADRPEMSDPQAWLQQERELWQQRATRQD